MSKRNDGLIMSVVGVVAVLFAVAWLWNAAKFLSCDFESNYKCEIAHGIGIFVVPLSAATVWVDSDK